MLAVHTLSPVVIALHTQSACELLLVSVLSTSEHSKTLASLISKQALPHLPQWLLLLQPLLRSSALLAAFSVRQSAN